MRPILWLPSSCALLLFLNGCANKGGTASNDPLGTGPFDSAGNYREEWANDPSKWRKPGTRSPKPATSGDDLPVIAKNEEPPPNANPLNPAGSYNPKSNPSRVRPPAIAPPDVSPHGSKARPKTAAHVAKSHSEPAARVTKTRHKSSPEDSPKAKPKSARYLVKKGDSLSAIASRNHSSVSAIRKANGISGNLIHPGDALTIPKR